MRSFRRTSYQGIISHHAGAGELTEQCLQSVEVDEEEEEGRSDTGRFDTG